MAAIKGRHFFLHQTGTIDNKKHEGTKTQESGIKTISLQN
jgi:hypothetical protein